jgi:hypothetical protein
MKLWAGLREHTAQAQKAFHHRARLNSAARAGEYDPAMESAA